MNIICYIFMQEVALFMKLCLVTKLAQVRYRRKDGSKWLKVISYYKEVTMDRTVHEKASNVAVTLVAV